MNCWCHGLRFMRSKLTILLVVVAVVVFLCGEPRSGRAGKEVSLKSARSK